MHERQNFFFEILVSLSCPPVPRKLFLGPWLEELLVSESKEQYLFFWLGLLESPNGSAEVSVKYPFIYIQNYSLLFMDPKRTEFTSQLTRLEIANFIRLYLKSIYILGLRYKQLLFSFHPHTYTYNTTSGKNACNFVPSSLSSQSALGAGTPHRARPSGKEKARN